MAIFPSPTPAYCFIAAAFASAARRARQQRTVGGGGQCFHTQGLLRPLAVSRVMGVEPKLVGAARTWEVGPWGLDRYLKITSQL